MHIQLLLNLPYPVKITAVGVTTYVVCELISRIPPLVQAHPIYLPKITQITGRVFHLLGHLPIIPIHLLTGGRFPPPVIEACVTGPIFEEIGLRYLFQEKCLRALPIALVQYLSPSLTQYVDHPAVQIARVALSALVFASMHDFAHEPFGIENPYGGAALPYLFVLGLVCATAQELTHSVASPILIHAINNGLTQLITGIRH